MEFLQFWDKDFFSSHHISVQNPVAVEKTKEISFELIIKKPLLIEDFKALLKGLNSLKKSYRKYNFVYLIKYEDSDEKNNHLYLEYYHYLLGEIDIDYDLLTLSTYNVSYEDGAFKIVVVDRKFITDKMIEKATGRFSQYGFKIKIDVNLISKEETTSMIEEIAEKNAMEANEIIKGQEELSLKQKKIEEINHRPKKFLVQSSLDDKVSSISSIPATQSGLDELINTTGSTNFVVEGEVFNVASRKFERSTLFEVSITDDIDSIIIKRFVKTENDLELYSSLTEGDIIKVSAKAEYDSYAREVVLNPSRICLVGKKSKDNGVMDTAEEKRVELHLHTNMSALDAITPAEDYVKEALKWGHKAIAFTDHDGLYCYHDVMLAVKDKPIKPIYGVELGFVDEKKFNIAYTVEDIMLKDATYVVFDLETTGFSVTYDEIIQIGARKVQHGQVIANFDRFVKPKGIIPKKITELTSIDEEKVKDASPIEVVLPDFIKFIGDSILVAQNASFDVGHLYANMKRLGIEIIKEFPVIDTMQLARNFYGNELKSFNLKSLSRYFKVTQEHHHLADDDTRVTTEIFLQMLPTLYKNGIYNYNEINKHINFDEAYKHIIPRHINLLVKNQVGYKNLFKIVSDALTVHFYNESRLLKGVLDKYREGVLVGSGCINGEVFEIALNKSDEELEEVVKYYDYIEVQPVDIYVCSLKRDNYDDIDYKARVIDTIKRIIKVADKCNKPLVATSDCHYLYKEQKSYRDVYISAPQLGGGIHSLAGCVKTPLQHLRTTNEMLEDFEFLGKDLAYEIVIKNTNLIADMIEDIIPFRTGKEDLYSPRDDEFKEVLNLPSIKDDLVHLVYEKANHDYGDPLPKFVQDRLDKELNSIINNGYSPVYYLAYLLVHKSNSDGYVVGSRGSVGSSFVATMMKITEVNPLPPHYYCPKCHFSAFKFTSEEKEKYPLTKEQQSLDPYLQEVGSGYDLKSCNCPCCNTPLKKDGQDIPFETFLGFSGDKTPDIDLNFSGQYQGRAHEYIRTLMGSERAFRAGTVTTVATNTAIGYIRGYLERKGITKRNVEIARIAKKIEGVRRSTGQHPGGIVIVPSYKDIYDVTPIQYPADKTDNNWRTTHFEYHNFEANLLKLDILGHDDPTTLRYIFDYVEAHPDEFPFSTPQGIPLDDLDVYKMFNETSVLGLKSEDIGCEVATFAIPEFGTRFTRQMLIDTKPKTFADLVKISGLSHGTDVWNNNCQSLVLGKTEFGKISFEDVIGCRDDIMVHLIECGLPPKSAFDIMEFVRKGKAAKHTDPEKWARFVAIMKEKGVPDWYIWSCERIAYMFPKAHAVAYVLMAIRIAWFKVHKPTLFYSAFFSIRAGQFEPDVMLAGLNKIRSRIEELNNLTKTTAKDDDLLTMYQVAVEMLMRGYKFLPVDIMKSHATHFVIEGDALRLPFISIGGLGESVAIDIVDKRNEKAFSSKADVLSRTKLNKTLGEKMEKLGCFGDLKDEEDVLESGLFAL